MGCVSCYLDRTRECPILSSMDLSEYSAGIRNGNMCDHQTAAICNVS